MGDLVLSKKKKKQRDSMAAFTQRINETDILADSCFTPFRDSERLPLAQ